MTIKHLKEYFIPEKLCQSNKAQSLLPFVKTVFELKFDEKPYYHYLKFLLVKVLLDKNVAPDHKYDWNWQRRSSVNMFGISDEYQSDNRDLDRVEEIDSQDL